MHSDDYCHFNEENQLQLPTNITDTESSYGKVLYSDDDGKSMDIMFIGAWVIAFAAGWFICGLIRWKIKKTVRDKQEEHVRQQTIQNIASLDPEFIQQILKVSGTGQDIHDLVDVDVGDHNPNDDVLPPAWGESDSELVPEPMPVGGPISMRVRTTTGDNLAVEITPPSQDAPDPPQPSPSPAPSDYAQW